jgi:hypothetical protein
MTQRIVVTTDQPSEAAATGALGALHRLAIAYPGSELCRVKLDTIVSFEDGSSEFLPAGSLLLKRGDFAIASLVRESSS